MLETKLKQHFLEIVLSVPQFGEVYTGGEILKRTEMLTRAMSCIGVDSGDVVGIYCDNPANTVISVLACMAYGANFTILSPTEDLRDTKVKMVLSSVTHGLLISERVIDEGILTLHPETIKIISKGWNYMALDEEEKNEVNNIFQTVNNVIGEGEAMDEDAISLPENFMDERSDEICINWHTGISKGIFNADKFKHTSIIVGIANSIHDLYNTKGTAANAPIRGPMLMLEPVEALYDIVNGVIAPMLKGIHVIIGDGDSIDEVAASIMMYYSKLMYINSNKLRALLRVLEKEVPTWAKWLGLKNFHMRRDFNNIGYPIKHIIITGKVKEPKLFNAIKRKYTLLYTMSEVASFIAKGTFTKIPKRIWLMPRSNVLLTTTGGDNIYGEINIKTEDLFESYLFGEGNIVAKTDDVFRTEDIGLLRNDKIYIKDKAKNIYVNNNGLVIETGNILAIAKRLKHIKEATVVIHKNKLILVIEPDFEYIESRPTLFSDVEKIKESFENLRLEINKKVDVYSRISRVITISNPKGLYRKNFKIISRHF